MLPNQPSRRLGLFLGAAALHPAALRLLALLVLGGATPAWGQSIDPRSFVNTPVGMNFLVGGYTHQTGNVLFDPMLPIEDAKLTIQGPLAAFARALDLWGLSGKTDATFAMACADGHATFNGAPQSRHVCGLVDPSAGLSVNFIGAPALSLREYPSYKQNVLVGANLRVTAPLGQYDSQRLVNLGTHRWSFKPGLGVSKAAGRLTLELLAAVTFYTTNGDFYGGHTLQQAPLLSGQLNIIYTFKSGIWGALGGTLYGGGRTTTDGVASNEFQENTRVGAVLVFPIGRHNSLKVYGSIGASTRTGTDFDTIALAWTHNWGGRR
jgi:hypothetical protein